MPALDAIGTTMVIRKVGVNTPIKAMTANAPKGDVDVVGKLGPLNTCTVLSTRANVAPLRHLEGTYYQHYLYLAYTQLDSQLRFILFFMKSA